LIFVRVILFGVMGRWRIVRRRQQPPNGLLGKYVNHTEKIANAALESAQAAKASADATNRSIDMTVEKERARIFVEVFPLDLTAPSLMTHVVEFQVVFHGSTFAFIEDTKAQPTYSDSAEPPLRGLYLWECQHSTGNPPGLESKKCNALFFRVFDGVQIANIKAQKLFIHFRGWIKYKDFTGIGRQTSFCYTWKASGPTPALPWERWEKSGTPEANQQT
jgi:hypothetical protein